jgi:hypothetical protein
MVSAAFGRNGQKYLMRMHTRVAWSCVYLSAAGLMPAMAENKSKFLSFECRTLRATSLLAMKQPSSRAINQKLAGRIPGCETCQASVRRRRRRLKM